MGSRVTDLPDATPFLSGEMVELYQPLEEEAELLADWINDHEVTRLMFTGLTPVSPETVRKQWEESRGNPNEIVFSVYASAKFNGKHPSLLEGDNFLGTTGLYGINWIARTAEFRVFLGNKNCWGHGVGTECTRLMVVHAFEKLNLNRVWLGVNAENPGARKAYAKAGFVEEGRLRQEQYRNGRYYDAIRMSILRTEYNAHREEYLDGLGIAERG